MRCRLIETVAEAIEADWVVETMEEVRAAPELKMGIAEAVMVMDWEAAAKAADVRAAVRAVVQGVAMLCHPIRAGGSPPNRRSSGESSDGWMGERHDGMAPAAE